MSVYSERAPKQKQPKVHEEMPAEWWNRYNNNIIIKLYLCSKLKWFSFGFYFLCV